MTRLGQRVVRGLGAAAVVVGAGACGHYRPAQFADRMVVTAVRDDAPIPVPSQRGFDESEQVADIYIRRPLFDFVRPTDFPTGGDVNALDEVPSSSWYDPAFASSPAPPPTPPLVALDEPAVTSEGALAVRDALGHRYELLADPRDREGLRSGATVVGGHLLRALGLHSPNAWIVGVAESALGSTDAKSNTRLENWFAKNPVATGVIHRVSATLWPALAGIDVGITNDYGKRSDDANDMVDHHDRRTLRATKIFAHWMGWTAFDVRATRDVYVGPAGQGHLVHYVFGTSRAFGTQDLQATTVRDEDTGSFWWNLVTLGLSAPRTRAAQISVYPSLGYFPAVLDADDFHVSPPYSPFVRLTAADEYWAAKRLLAVSDDAIAEGMTAALLPSDAARHLEDVLRSRRRILVAHAMAQVTPLDFAGIAGTVLWLRDTAISAGVAIASITRYDVSVLDDEGRELTRRLHVAAAGELTPFTVPAEIASGSVVLQVTAVRGGVASPRACDLHVVVGPGSLRLIGLRH